MCFARPGHRATRFQIKIRPVLLDPSGRVVQVVESTPRKLVLRGLLDIENEWLPGTDLPR